MVPGSTGSVGSAKSPSVLSTSGKKDSFRFAIHQGTDSTTTTNIYAELIDTSRTDFSQQTRNVTEITKGSDMIIS
jgi:hypothetical protein